MKKEKNIIKVFPDKESIHRHGVRQRAVFFLFNKNAEGFILTNKVGGTFAKDNILLKGKALVLFNMHTTDTREK